MFDWYRPCAYDGAQKRKFHREARASLRALAKELRFPESSFDLRSNQGASPSAARSRCIMIGSTSRFANLRRAPTAEF